MMTSKRKPRIRIVVRLILAATSASLVHCSMPDDVKSAAKTSERLEENTKKLQQESAVLKALTRNLFYGARKDLAGFERPDMRFKDVLESPHNTNKVLYAIAMASSYSFQQWTEADSIEAKEQMHQEAVRDLLPRVEPLINHDYDANSSLDKFLNDTEYNASLSSIVTMFPRLFYQAARSFDIVKNNVKRVPMMPDNKWKSLASIAAALGEVDKDQAKAAVAKGVQPESLYTLIVKGLKYKAKVDRKEAAPSYATEVNRWNKEAIHLLQMRHNYLIAMSLSRFTDFCVGPVEEIKSFLKAWWGVELDAPEDSLAKIDEHGIRWLKDAQETQQVLASLGQPLQFSYPLMTIFSMVKFKAPEGVTVTAEVDNGLWELTKLAEELKVAYQTGKAKELELRDDLLLPEEILAKKAVEVKAK